MGFLGARGRGFAETSVLRCAFRRLTASGIQLGNLNALDLWVWDCLFESCYAGVSNDPGAGAFRVNRSVFRECVMDLQILNTQEFSARHNTSWRSGQFFFAGYTANPAIITLQGNTIMDPTDALPIEIRNHGPLFLFDNVVRSPEGATGPVVAHISHPSWETIAVGNTFTVSSPLQAESRLIEIDTTVVTRASLAALGVPVLPSAPPALPYPVLEVTAGASAATIQTALTTAANAPGTRTIVHLPAGTYSLTASLDLAAGSDVQLVGDGYGTQLVWAGAGSGPVLALHGPSTAVVRDLEIQAAGDWGILIDGIDQVGARLGLQQVRWYYNTEASVWIDGLDHTLVEVRNADMAYMATGTGLLVSGGVLAQAQTPGAGRTLWFSGSTSNNAATVAVRQFGTVLVRDSWYESTTLSGFCVLGAVDGTLTLDNVRVATPLLDTPAPVTCAGTRGRVALIGLALDDRIVLTGNGSALELLALGAVGNNLSETLPDYFQDTTSPAADARLLLSRQKVVGDYGSEQVANEGSVNTPFVTTMLALVRSSIPGLWTPLPPGVSDVRLHRVSIRDASIGLHAVSALPVPGQRPLRPVISAARRRRW